MSGSSTIWMNSRDANWSDAVLISLWMLLSDEPDDGDDDGEESDTTKDINRTCWLPWSPIIDPGGGISSSYAMIQKTNPPESWHRREIRYAERPINQRFLHEPPSCYTLEARESYDRYKTSRMLSFPNNWKELLQPGHTYDVLWTGAAISRWDWGTPTEEKESKQPPVLVPGGAYVTFKVEEGSPPPIPRPETPPPIQASERIPGAPVLSLELSCKATMAMNESQGMHIKVTYHGLSNIKDTTDEFSVYRRRRPDQSSPETKEWQTFQGNEYCRYGLYDNPDQLINVSENPDDFVTLCPGESWSNFWTMRGDGYDLPDCDELESGEKLRYQFQGNVLNWWNWGTAKDHEQTIVKKYGWGGGPVIEPRDNGGRPKVVVPGSNVLEWTMISE
ncbi:hypothetical protein N7520_006977 [Penicillium odoratum]|uniref:uncharacterized protein n=1 Tax=Penicillium odoratum TaxID=1167516 RepID=UPI002547C0A9|nr:uncharacterized protein N7520_006977 [Penicillium odoratum]KAJ5759821.1 hypothetical protein N7520_006977 [Penicillium odoratum]